MNSLQKIAGENVFDRSYVAPGATKLTDIQQNNVNWQTNEEKTILLKPENQRHFNTHLNKIRKLCKKTETV